MGYEIATLIASKDRDRVMANISFTLPPLRDRMGDIPLLVDFYTKSFSMQPPKKIGYPFQYALVYCPPPPKRL